MNKLEKAIEVRAQLDRAQMLGACTAKCQLAAWMLGAADHGLPKRVPAAFLGTDLAAAYEEGYEIATAISEEPAVCGGFFNEVVDFSATAY